MDGEGITPLLIPRETRRLEGVNRPPDAHVTLRRTGPEARTMPSDPQPQSETAQILQFMMQNAQQERQAWETARREERVERDRATQAQDRRIQQWMDAQERARAGGEGDRFQPQEKVPKYKLMEKGADLATFLVGFEAHMRNYEVPIHKWHKALVLALNEEAVEAYGRAPEGSQGNYGLLKKHLMGEFHINADTYRRKFDSVKSNESWATTEGRLETYMRRWLEECTNKEEILQKVLMEALYKLMPTFLARRIRELKPTHPREQAAMADTYLYESGKRSSVEQTQKKPEGSGFKPISNNQYRKPHPQSTSNLRTTLLRLQITTRSKLQREGTA